MESSCQLPVVSCQTLVRTLISSDCNNEVGGTVEVETGAGRDDRGGAVFGDDGGAGVFSAAAEVVSGVDLRFEFLAVEQDWSFERGRPAGRCSAWTGEGARPYMGRGSSQCRAEAEGY